MIIAITVILCRIYNAISLNAVVFAAVCLASTMNAAIEGFALVSISVHIFAFAPRFNKVLHSCTNSLIECNSHLQHFSCTNVVLVWLTTVLLITISLNAAVLFLTAILSILVVFPLWLYSLQSLKK